MSPFFSICIPNFNYSTYVNKTIESVLSQSFIDFEIVVVDNASTDTSWEVIQAYGRKDTRIRAFKNECNVGFAPNLQKATQLSQGKFVILLSSDDIMFEGALQTYYDVLQEQREKSQKTVLHSAFDQIDASGDYIKTVVREHGSFKGSFVQKNNPDKLVFRTEKQNPLDAARYALKTNYGIGAFLTICYPKELWTRVEGYDPQYFIFPDKAFLLKLLLLEPDYIYVNKVLFGYRIHSSNQNSKNAGQAALKHQVDGYMRTINFPESDLQRLKLTRHDLQVAFIQNLCEKHAMIAYAQNFRTKAFKILCFAYATYPVISVKRSRMWLLKIFLLTGPAGHFIVKLFKGGGKQIPQ